MAQMALAAEHGGAVGIRANGREDIAAIRAVSRLPVIGIFKTLYPTSDVRITPTFEEAAEVAGAGAALVAVDGTSRPRPRGETLTGLIRRIHDELGIPVVADVSTLDEGIEAAGSGADAVATTLSGYVAGSPDLKGPDLDLVERLASAVSIPVIAEGRYDTPSDVAGAMKRGAYGVVVGTAITRPQILTQRFVAAIKEVGEQRTEN